MKLIRAIIKPEQLDSVRKALEANGFRGITVTEIEGCGEERSGSPETRNGLMPGGLQKGLQIEIVVDYYRVDLLVSTIAEACKTGTINDGRIFVMQVERAILVRGGKTQEDALQGICSTSEPVL
ncbi:Nitrogen regulatory protein P-II [anaerobic digester metagenome]